jgi:hypothetical protein
MDVNALGEILAGTRTRPNQVRTPRREIIPSPANLIQLPSLAAGRLRMQFSKAAGICHHNGRWSALRRLGRGINGLFALIRSSGSAVTRIRFGQAAPCAMGSVTSNCSGP